MAVCLYVTQTYYGTEDPEDQELTKQMDLAETYLTFFFVFDYLVHLYAAESRIKHIFRFAVLIGNAFAPTVQNRFCLLIQMSGRLARTTN